MNKEEVIIRTPGTEELNSIYAFFQIVLKDTFEINGIGDLAELLEEELQDKRRCINQYFDTDGRDRFFLIAEFNHEIIGSIEYGLSNELLKRCTNDEMKDLYEIGTVFVHPKYQKKGISSLLLHHIFNALNSRGIEEVCFDSGYRIAQKIWCGKFGEPEYYLRNYWGEGSHHMVWRVRVKDALYKINLE